MDFHYIIMLRTPFPLAVPQIFPGVWPLSIQGTILWPLHSAQGIFQSPHSVGDTPLQTRDCNLLIPRWLPHQGSIHSWRVQSHKKNDGSFLKTLSPDKHAKINTHTSTTTGVYWWPIRYYKGHSLPSAHKFSAIVSLISTVRTSAQISGRTCLQLLGHMAVATFAVKHTRWHMRCLQRWIWSVYVPDRHSLNKLLWIHSRSRTQIDGHNPEMSAWGLPSSSHHHPWYWQVIPPYSVGEHIYRPT